jgi:hypothetical protein
LNHVFYSDGNAQKITWIIQNDDSSFFENREHVDMYKDKVTNLQSKYIALHVGLFWGIGTFIIKNKDTVKIKLDEKIMFDQFTTDSKIEDSFIQKRLQFIKQLLVQRKLKIEFEVISQDENIAKNNI